MSNINDLITAYHVGVVQGWAGEEQAQRAMEEIRADPDRFLLFAPPVYASGYQRPEHFSLHRISRRVLGKDVGGGVQQIGDCFVAGTMVRMADGSEKPIESVSVGDSVVTHNNRCRKVLRTIKKPYSGKLVTVELSGYCVGLTATPDHRMVHYDRRGTGRNDPRRAKTTRFSEQFSWTPVGKLTRGERLLVASGPKEQSGETVSLDLVSYLNTDELLIENETIRPLTSGKRINRHIKVDEKFGRFIGLYLAEGSVDVYSGKPRCIDFSFNISEVDLAQEVMKLSKELFGIDCSEEVRVEQNVRIVSIASTVAASFIKALIPGDSRTKRLPTCIFQSSLSTRKACLRGWLDGDGHVRQNNPGSSKLVVIGVSSSEGLRRDIFYLAQGCGLSPRLTVRKKMSHQRVAAGQVSFYGETATGIYPELPFEKTRSAKKVCHTDRGLALPIKSVKETTVSNIHVYCLEVEDDHSFLANGIAVSNCVSWGMKHALEYLQTTMIALGKARIKYRPIFAPYLYGTGRVYVGKGRLGNGDGSLGSWMAEAVIKYGALFSDDKDVPTYSGSIAKRWGDPNPADDLDRFVKLGQERLVAKAPQVKSWDDLCDLLAAGIPCTVASNQGFRMEPGRDGYHEASGSWPHQMMIYGYGPDYALICNSWGDVHGRLQCFHEKDDLPIATIRARRRTIEGMIRAGETFGVMDMRGSPLEPIPESLFRIVG